MSFTTTGLLNSLLATATLLRFLPDPDAFQPPHDAASNVCFDTVIIMALSTHLWRICRRRGKSDTLYRGDEAASGADYGSELESGYVALLYMLWMEVMRVVLDLDLLNSRRGEFVARFH